VRRVAAAVCVAALGLSAACSGSESSRSGSTYTIVVSAPLTTQPWVGQFVERGARLAVEEINADGGIGDVHRKLRLVVVDDASSPRTALANARRAVRDNAAAFITSGVGTVAVADVSGPANLPVFVVFDGGASIIDPQKRPNVFRIAPANKPMATRLADYVAARQPKVAMIVDDTSYGRDGAVALKAGFLRDHIPLVSSSVVPTDGAGIAPAIVRARNAGATLLVTWASAPVVAGVIRAARSSKWSVPLFTGPTGEDPLVRQQLADHRNWIDGVHFVSFRITAEVGPKPFEAFRTAYEKRFGADKVGVSDGGTPVLMPPDYAMFSYDTVHLVAACLEKSNAVGAPLMRALDNTVVTGANGDERGFIPGQREGVVSDDMYFGRFEGFRFKPVTDDVLSEHLPVVPQ
jgi:ABC-type branched-subunit amino acid transport system substrate-binding protein